MKIFKQHLKTATFALGLAASLAMYSCEDHRLAPTEQALPDRIFYALSDNNQLHELNVKNTTTPLRSFSITGLESGDVLAGIDFRPATGQLYAISAQSNLYQINVKSGDQQGKATRIGTAPIATALSGSNIGFDFNPTVDRIRVVTNTAQNLRLHPETGAVVPGDSPLNGPSTTIGAVAYTNSRAGVTPAPGAGTTLYDIDPVADMLYIQNPPNPGALVAVGGLGLDIQDIGGFDISPDMNSADVYPIASVKIAGEWELDYVNLTSGKLQKLGKLPTGVNIIGIAIPSLPVAYALDGSNNIKIFNPTNGYDFGMKVVSGIPSGVMLQGIDIRPVNGRLYALGSNSKIYGIDLGSGAATELASLKLADNTPVTISGTVFGVDFNPVADRLRVVSNTGQSLRINVTDGVTIVDGSLKIGVGGPTPFVTAAAYTNSYPGVTATTLFDIDSQSNLLYKQMPPNDGILIDPKSLGIDVDATIGFDIGNVSGTGYAIFTVAGNTSFYSVDLTSGAVQHKFPFSTPVKGLALGFGL
ncbi:DUF4394 domain-containing protein [Dyadobacter frigoris]|uniref:DUF4394 domain-containing protein n=1 Tax=Dyadobacter frigoris TaxID=2576211 RepID=A0A4U6D4G1_9BACT|nr:DUF4394 domain-containing protein [Dyadobacter frigoris]TKT88864.1 DUF4394 domain-containing protein [Dyadobacter frigoris]GLU56054.1 hypothetical protein Dfri01_55150 [Dyadobacter frigoris]